MAPWHVLDDQRGIPGHAVEKGKKNTSPGVEAEDHGDG